MSILLIFHNEINPAFGFTIVVCSKLISSQVASLYVECKEDEVIDLLKKNALHIEYVPAGNMLHSQILKIVEKQAFIKSDNMYLGSRN